MQKAGHSKPLARRLQCGQDKASFVQNSPHSSSKEKMRKSPLLPDKGPTHNHKDTSMHTQDPTHTGEIRMVMDSTLANTVFFYVLKSFFKTMSTKRMVSCVSLCVNAHLK